MTTPEQTAEKPHEAPGAATGCWCWSTDGFTLMFAVWLQFGILGLPIQQEFGFSDTAPSTGATALPVLNGAIWRLPAGLIADRVGGQGRLHGGMLAHDRPCRPCCSPTPPAWRSCSVLPCLPDRVAPATSFSVGISWNSASVPPQPAGLRPWRVRRRQRRCVGHEADRLRPIAATAGTVYLGGRGRRAGWRLDPRALRRTPGSGWPPAIGFRTPRHDRKPGAPRASRPNKLRPLRQTRVWRVSVYHVVVLGGYVALAPRAAEVRRRTPVRP